MIRKLAAIGAIGALHLMVLPHTGIAQAGAEPVAAPAAGEWTAWYGCWSADPRAPDPMVCMVPSVEPQAVRVLTVGGQQILSDETIHADGVARPVSDGGCAGSEQGSWSSDGRRVYLRTEMRCAGLDRVSTRILAFVDSDRWIDAEAVEVAGEEAARAVEYRIVPAMEVLPSIAGELPRQREMEIDAARIGAATVLDLEMIVEAARAVAAPALDAVLAARGRAIHLDGRTLVHLDRAGVSASTIDVLVALNFPEVLQLRDPAETGWYAQGTPAPRASAFGVDCDPRYLDWRLRDLCPASLYGSSGWRFGYGGFGYGGYGYGGFAPYGWRYGGPVVVVVRPDGEITPEQSPRLVPGRGYTRGGGTAGSSGAQPRPASSPAPSPAATPSTSTSGSSGSSSSGSSTPARTAVPRDQ